MSDHQTFLRGNDEDFKPRFVPRNSSFAVDRSLISIRIERHSQRFEPAADPLTNVRGILTDSASKDDRRHIAFRRQIGADILSNSISEHVESEADSLLGLSRDEFASVFGVS